MLSLFPLHKLPVRAILTAVGLASVLFLLLQTFGPVLASPDQNVRAKICPKSDTVWDEADIEDDVEDSTAYCTECTDCALCAVTSAEQVQELLEVAQTGIVQFAGREISRSLELNNSKWLWPETRRSPRGPEIRTQRALCATTPSTELAGGAPWS